VSGMIEGCEVGWDEGFFMVGPLSVFGDRVSDDTVEDASPGDGLFGCIGNGVLSGGLFGASLPVGESGSGHMAPFSAVGFPLMSVVDDVSEELDGGRDFLAGEAERLDAGGGPCGKDAISHADSFVIHEGIEVVESLFRPGGWVCVADTEG